MLFEAEKGMKKKFERDKKAKKSCSLKEQDFC